MKKYGVLIAALVIGSVAAFAAPQIIVSNSLSVHGTPQYGPDFTHFDYANPNAPQGGTLRMHSIGTFDSFNPFAQSGNYEGASGSMFDSLMTGDESEVDVYYALIARTVEYPSDYSWIIFHINPDAKFQDGTPIRADDVVYSYNKFMEQGVPQFKQYYSFVDKVDVVDPLSVKFTLKNGDRAQMVSLATINVLPKSYWQNHDLSKPLTTPPAGSGPYVVKDFKMGQYVIYQRLSNYWAKDLPAVKGLLNFDYVRYDYYRDETVAFEAFKAGDYDFYNENISKNWATGYTGKNFDNGNIVKKELPNGSPLPMQALVFNTQKPLFADRRVREAIGYALDFQWMNKNLFYDQYTRVRSYFQNTQYEAKGLPSPEELKILDPVKNQIPPEVFTQEYNPPVTDGSGNIRPQIRDALSLFEAAGWELQNGKLVNAKTGDPMEFELLMYSPSLERVAEPIKQNLARMGITMNIRLVDTTQFVNRLRSGDYDIISSAYGPYYYPSPDLQIQWESDYVKSTWNTAQVQDPAVDYLIKGIVAHQDDPQALVYWGRALDRVLTWNFYVIPEWGIDKFRIAYWNKFGMPGTQPKYAVGVDSWWYDESRAAALQK